jgi:hypothetical protein
MKPETRFKNQVYQKLLALAARTDEPMWVEKIQQVTIRGTPDLMICFRGNFVAWELKTNEGKLDTLQKYKLDRIEKSGGIARVVSPATLDQHIKELQCLTKPQNQPKIP